MNLAVNFAGVSMKNPVTTASGTFGSGAEYGEYVDLNRLGAVTTKGVANVPWPGNPTPRVCETKNTMLQRWQNRDSFCRCIAMMAADCSQDRSVYARLTRLSA